MSENFLFDHGKGRLQSKNMFSKAKEDIMDPKDGKKPIRLTIRNGKLRVSIHYYNTEEEIDELIERLVEFTP